MSCVNEIKEYTVIKKFFSMSTKENHMKITNIDDAFENVFNYYRSDPTIRAMFKEENLAIAVKFGDTKRVYTVNVRQDQEIFLDRNPPMNKPDIRIKIKSEQVLLDLVNEDLLLTKAFAKMQIRIAKGVIKIAKLARKSRNFLSDLGELNDNPD